MVASVIGRLMLALEALGSVGFEGAGRYHSPVGFECFVYALTQSTLAAVVGSRSLVSSNRQP